MEKTDLQDGKDIYESLISRYESCLSSYMNKARRDEGAVPKDRIAKELSVIDKEAKEKLISDPKGLYGIESYEEERRKLRAKALSL